VAMSSGHLAPGPLWMASTATARMMTSFLPLVLRGTLYSSPSLAPGCRSR
jgi:hypothetical protein